MDVAVTETPDTLFCDAGTCAPEIEQQDALGDGAILASSPAMFIRSH
jgi:hypothetical protein